MISFFTSCAVNTSLLENYEYPKELKDKLNSDETMVTRDVMVAGGKSYRYVVTEIIPKIKENRKSEDKSLKKQTRKKLKAELDSIKCLLISYKKKLLTAETIKKTNNFIQR